MPAPGTRRAPTITPGSRRAPTPTHPNHNHSAYPAPSLSRPQRPQPPPDLPGRIAADLQCHDLSIVHRDNQRMKKLVRPPG
ncbi:hypothetical protein GCM10028799_71470 [Kribbella italica]